jgi:hypothetical protein
VTGEFSFRFIGATSLPAGLVARAFATQGDLVVAVAIDPTAASPATVVLTYDLAALAAGTATPLGQITLAEHAVSGCAAPALNGGAASFAEAPKQVQIYGRDAFVSSGTGDLFAVDIADPAHPTNAYATTNAWQTNGCTYGFDIHWPFVFIADGTGVTPTTTSPLLRTFSITGTKLTTSDRVLSSTGLESTTAARFLAGASPLAGLLLGHVDSNNVNGALIDLTQADPETGSQVWPGVVGGHTYFTMTSTANAIIVTRSPYASGLGGVDLYYSPGEEGPQINTPNHALSTLSVGPYILVGEDGSRGVDVIDLATNKLVGLFPGGGNARGLAASGPYVVVADDKDGLVLANVADIGVIANAGEQYAESVPSVDGNILYIADSLANNDGLLKQPLQNITETPIGLGAGAGQIFCRVIDVDSGHVACGAQLETDASVHRACLTDVGGGPASWSPGCLGGVTSHTLDTLASEALYGPALILSYQSPQSGSEARVRVLTTLGVPPAVQDHILLSDNDAYDSTNDAGTPGFVSLGAAQAEAASRISVQGALAAIATSAGVDVVSLGDFTAPTLLHHHDGLTAPIVNLGELCAVQIASGSATLVCVDAASGAAHLSVPLGPTVATQAALAKHGLLAFVELTGDVVETVDLTAQKITAAFSLQTTLPTIQVQGPFVYTACTLGVCQLAIKK